jgi:DNA-binding transcriptional ArsR family regulator
VIELVFGSVSSHRVRFAASPCDEVLNAVRNAVLRVGHPIHHDFLAMVREALPTLDVTELTNTLSARHYWPDFLTQQPKGPHTTVDRQVHRIRRTPLRQVRRELAMTFLENPAPERLTEPRQARELLADQVDRCWRALVEPHWPWLSELLAADIEYRARQLATAGLDAVFADLHPTIRLAGDAVLVESVAPHRQRVALDERGLLLLPCVLAWPNVGVMNVAPWPPAIVYPARGAGDRPAPRPSTALGDVLGRTKARLLLTLDEPMSTGALAARLDLAPSTVSEHLGALHAVGLLRRWRVGGSARYARTSLGDGLVAG